jgi:uncharacterized protein YkwD
MKKSVFRLGTVLVLWGTSVGATGQRPTPPAQSPERLIQDVIVRTNVERAKHGLLPLKHNATLSKAATWLAKDMAERSYFDHTDRLGRDIDKRLPDLGYEDYRAIGENIAAGQRDAAEVVAGWMKSPGHRANILSDSFREIGVGFASGRGKLRTYWVQDFGARKDVYPVIINNEEAQTRGRTVRLSLHGKGWAEEMRLRNSGAVWTDWQAFDAEMTWTLPPGPGGKTVTVELRRGNRSVSSQDSIELLPEGRG